MSKKIKEVMTVSLPKPETPNAVESIVASLNSLVASQGWAIIVKILNDNIIYLEKAILDKIDPATKMPLTDKEVEILRIKRNLNIDVRDTPKNYATVVRDTGGEPKEYDPYWKTYEDMVKAREIK